MDEQSLKIVKCLVKMAKADGNISPEERSLLVQVLPAAGATTEAADDLEKLLDKLIEEVAAGDAIELQRELDVALGAAWDEELEPFRHASDDAPVVWLHKVG